MTKKKPQTPNPFTIIIPALNEAKYLPLLLQDLSLQTYRQFVVTIVDGNSTDQTIAKAKTFVPKLPQLNIHTTEIRNVSHQRNLGARYADTPWLIFMDADNRLPPYFLQGIKYRLEVHQPDLFSTCIIPDSTHSKDLAITKLVNLYLDLQQTTPRGGGLESMLGFSTSVFNKLKGFDPQVRWGEGGDICRRAYFQKFKFVLFKDPKYTYSFRRLRQEGTLKLARTIAPLEFARLTNRKLSPEKVSLAYPMLGGSQFPQDKKLNPVERILKDVSKIRSLPQKYFTSPYFPPPPKSVISKITHLFSKQKGQFK